MHPNPWETSSSSWESHPPQLAAAGGAQLKEFLPPGSFVSAVISTYFLSWRITRGCNEDVWVCILPLKLSFLSLVPPKVLKSTDRHLGLPWENITTPEACGCFPAILASRTVTLGFFSWDWFKSDYVLNWRTKPVISTEFVLVGNKPSSCSSLLLDFPHLQSELTGLRAPILPGAWSQVKQKAAFAEWFVHTLT